jgi:uncharacterized membrane protein YgcG
MRINIPRFFLSGDEKKAILAEIGELEKKSSAEIRVHLAKNVKGDIVKYSEAVFEKLGMADTSERNGVLVLLDIAERRFAVIGDKGINEKVPEHFWRKVADIMSDRFKQRLFAEGLVEGIRVIGEHLAFHFPRKADDVNELPDEISFS